MNKIAKDKARLGQINRIREDTKNGRSTAEDEASAGDELDGSTDNEKVSLTRF